MPPLSPATVLMLPGFGSSGPDHWQTLWEKKQRDSRLYRFVRVPLGHWNAPQRDAWVDALEAAVAESGPDTILVAHSLACLLVPYWAASTERTVRAAMLVSVPDAAGPDFPAAAVGFGGVPLSPLPFPSLVVGSVNDPYASESYMRGCAQAWGSRYVGVGACGHINADSDIGEWPEGYALLEALNAGR